MANRVDMAKEREAGAGCRMNFMMLGLHERWAILAYNGP
jgi:hypothetical protein